MTDHSLLEDAQQMTADGIVDLFEIRLRSNVVFRVKNNNSVTWQGALYNGFPCKLSGDARTADEEESRPNFTLANPEAIFHKAAFDGLIENSIIRRFRVLKKHLELDLPISVDRTWRVFRVSQLVRNKLISLELRNMSEGVNFMIPYGTYTPPEYPTVSL